MKKLATIMAIACATSVVSAQTVTSANIVGYTKDITTGAGFHIATMQFDDGVGTPTSVFGNSLPLGSKIYQWNGTGYSSVEYNSIFVPFVGPTVKWSADPVLGSGEGFWVEVPSASSAVLSGDVPSVGAVTNSISTGFNLLAFPYPVENVVTALDLTPALGDKIYVWNGSGYDTSEYNSIFVPFVGPTVKWSNESLSVGIGEGFWYEATAPQTWIANKPF